MRENFQKCLSVTLGYEGGKANNPKDPGGKTNRGVTQRTYDGWRKRRGLAPRDVYQITDGDLAAVYSEGYWRPVNGDRLAAGVDLAVFDAAVMSGPARALKWLMASIGGSDDRTVKKLCAARLGFVQSLTTWKTFGKGWASRVAGVEAKGVAWALAATMPAAAAKTKLMGESAAAKNSAGNNAAAAAGTGGVAGVAPGGLAANPAHIDQVAGWALAGIVMLAIVVVVLLAIRARNHRLRAEAYAAEAAATGGA